MVTILGLDHILILHWFWVW